ncbi:MAG: hypothetical protein JWR26_1975 [Pedosphaera sp.]|nr:hypothetical protein [Pedosphaera sp.]
MERREKGNENGLGTADLWAGFPRAGCSSVAAPLRGCSLLTPRLQRKSLAAPSAPICELASGRQPEPKIPLPRRYSISVDALIGQQFQEMSAVGGEFPMAAAFDDEASCGIFLFLGFVDGDDVESGFAFDL